MEHVPLADEVETSEAGRAHLAMSTNLVRDLFWEYRNTQHSYRPWMPFAFCMPLGLENRNLNSVVEDKWEGMLRFLKRENKTYWICYFEYQIENGSKDWVGGEIARLLYCWRVLRSEAKIESAEKWYGINFGKSKYRAVLYPGVGISLIPYNIIFFI